MSYATVMVHLELGRSNEGLLKVAGDVAERFHASVIGIAGRQPMNFTYAGDYGAAGLAYVPLDLIDQDQLEIKRQIKVAEAEFRTILQTRVATIEWRSAVLSEAVSSYIACEARSADLVLTGVAPSASLDASSLINIGDLLLRVGRPVLIVPASADKLSLNRVVVGWKDTREARRAAFDALPLLKKAAHVVVVEVTTEDPLDATRARLDDVVGWLKRRGITAEPIASHSTGDDASRLNTIALEQAADVIVAGAYGHSRLREWMFGGLTRDLLLRADRCALLSH